MRIRNKQKKIKNEKLLNTKSNAQLKVKKSFLNAKSRLIKILWKGPWIWIQILYGIIFFNVMKAFYFIKKIDDLFLFLYIK